MLSFGDHRRAHRLTASGDLAPFILATGGEQLRVEIGKVTRLRHRHPMIAPEVAGLAFDAALFVSFVGRAKLARKPPVRAKRDEARGFLAPIAAQDLLHRAFQVVVPEEPKNSTEKIEGVLVGLREGLLGRPLIRPPLHWPCCASQRLAAALARRSAPPTPHTSRPGLPVPARNSVARRSRASPNPAPVGAPARIGESSPPPLSAPAAPSRSAARCDARCDAACAA